MSKLSRKAAFEYISKWNTEEVIEFLKKNGLEQCCHAILKRQIDGDELLHLTEGKLVLWKSDLSRPQTWSLWTFVEELRRAPEEHVTHNIISMDNESVSESGSWGTDFEDEEDDDTTTKKKLDASKIDILHRSRDFRNSLLMFQQNEILKQNSLTAVKLNNSKSESLYINYECNIKSDTENNYMNLERETEPSQKRVSQFCTKFGKSLSEQLKISGPQISMSMEMTGDHEIMERKSTKSKVEPLQISFLHKNYTQCLSIVEDKNIEKCMMPPPCPEKRSFAMMEKYDEFSKPPIIFSNLDLVHDLPVKADESDEKYEQFDELLLAHNKVQIVSDLSHTSGSVESVYKSSINQGNNDCEIYEVITENPDDNGYYIEPIVHPNTKHISPPLPLTLNPLKSIGASTSTSFKIQKERERSPEKNSEILPYSGNTYQTSEMRATRPLPPPPFGQPNIESPWFHNINREQATARIKEYACDGTHNGFFLLRPSTSDLKSPLVLVLWYEDRVYNVPVRKRSDGRYALGSLKVNEQTFARVEDIIKFHTRQELLLYSGGVQMGTTKLTGTPPK